MASSLTRMARGAASRLVAIASAARASGSWSLGEADIAPHAAGRFVQHAAPRFFPSTAASETSAGDVPAAATRPQQTAGHASNAQAPAGDTDLASPLAFVNRYAEALDVLVPNLDNTESLDARKDIKFASPLAVQGPGTGKTALGLHLQDILRRPRDPLDVENALVPRLQQAGAFVRGGKNPFVVQHALASPEDENLVVRTLLALYPAQRTAILQLKDTAPIHIRMKDLVAPHFGFDKALAYAIFCNARGMSGSSNATKAAFLAQDSLLQTSVGAVQQLIDKRGGAPVVLTFADITDLGSAAFIDYFNDAACSAPLHKAMSELSMRLQVLHNVRGCFIYLTGRLLWSSTLALVGNNSSLFVTPMMLQPLSAADVRQTMQHTLMPDGSALQDALGVHPDLLVHVAETAARLSGGIGRPLQYLLRTQACVAQRAARAGAPLGLRSKPDVDAALERCMEIVGNAPGLKQLRVEWGGPAAAVQSGDMPQWMQQRAVQLQILQFLARLLLLDVAFHPATQWSGVEGTHEAFPLDKFWAPVPRIVDLANVLGVHYVAAGDGSNNVRLHAGNWLCRSMARDSTLFESPRALTIARMLDAMRKFNGTMRGRPFELLCAEALCFRHMMMQPVLQQPSTSATAQLAPVAHASTPLPTLGELLPHCTKTKLGTSIVSQLRVMAVPAVGMTTPLAVMSPTDRAAIEAQWLALPQQPASAPQVIHRDDLPWLLTHCLPVSALAVPVAAQPGSQNLFLGASGGVVGFALKAVAASSGTQWADVETELSQAPALPHGQSYVLVLWSLNLSAEMQHALRGLPHLVLGPGQWVLGADGRLVLLQAADGRASAGAASGKTRAANGKSKAPATKTADTIADGSPSAAAAIADGAATALATDGDASAANSTVKFTVPVGMELVLTNPHAESGGGLAEVLGQGLVQHLQASPPVQADVGTLKVWLAMEAASLLTAGAKTAAARRR